MEMFDMSCSPQGERRVQNNLIIIFVFGGFLKNIKIYFNIKNNESGDVVMIGIDMRGKITLITGAGGGIGGGIADVFAKAGSKVYVADLFYEDVLKKAEEIREKGFEAQPIQLDVTKKDDVYAVINKIVTDNSKIDNLITCAGIMYNKPYLETTDEEFRKVLEVNLLAVNNTCQAALIHMIPRKEGKIVNIESCSSRQGSDFFSHYSASKFGVLGLTQSIALAVAKDNINVNGICPGIVVTKLGEKQGGGLVQMRAKATGRTEEEMLEFIRMAIPMQRFQSGEDIGEAALFLCSDLAKNITAQALNVCGGMRMN
jgi:NAD(P)-dependent dehydrogenase (short-subunit alcohol dehydrogenase family)